jgi:hypothetical protein
MSRNTTFVGALLSGEAFLTEIDDYVDVWHEHGGEPAGYPQTLAAYLGFSDHEYQLWVERPEVLRFIVAARKKNRPIEHLIASEASLPAAARAEGDNEAAEVLHWLIKMGRVDDPRTKARHKIR